MTMLVVTPDRDSRRHDYSGAFDPEADAFCAMYGATRVLVNQAEPPRRRFHAVCAAVELHTPDRIVYCGHALKRSAQQIGLRGSLLDPEPNDNVHELAGVIAAGCQGPTIFLAACSAAGGLDGAPGGDGGLADSLRDACVKHGATGVTIYAHATAGHTTANPYVRRFRGPERKPDNVGGQYVIAPSDPLWPAWKCCSDFHGRTCPGRGLHGTLRFRFPWMTNDEIRAELEGH